MQGQGLLKGRLYFSLGGRLGCDLHQTTIVTNILDAVFVIDGVTSEESKQ